MSIKQLKRRQERLELIHDNITMEVVATYDPPAGPDGGQKAVDEMMDTMRGGGSGPMIPGLGAPAQQYDVREVPDTLLIRVTHESDGVKTIELSGEQLMMLEEILGKIIAPPTGFLVGPRRLGGL